MSRFKSLNTKIRTRGNRFTMLSPVLGKVTMSHLDLGGGKHVNGLLSDTIANSTATITVDAAVDPSGNGSVLSLGEVTLIEGVHWEVAVGDVNLTASNLATAIDNLTGFSATALGDVVNVEGANGASNLVFTQVDFTENLSLDPTTGTMTNGSPTIAEIEID